MSWKLTPADLGEPDLKVAGFQLWVHGRQFPEAEDYDDSNWIRVTAHCGASGASVWAQGAILMVTDIAGFGDECRAMLSGEIKLAALDPLEPELKVLLETADRLGHVRAQVEITPDHLAQAHRFEFEVDQSYLPGIIRQCSEIVQKYPIRGHQVRKGV
ncbi:MAG: hypothetical protein KF868_17945 [Acidobacteria bacterium]|nr:hypothetical protein [Acidobacteriota bacterium]MCW5969136.1 hypothetical protein [Blastocatellales bacterium]